MNLLTVEVELDQGRVVPKGGGILPQHAGALLTLLPPKPTAKRNPLERDPTLPRIVYHQDPTAPLAEDEWPEESR